jgi:hypothetical protein
VISALHGLEREVTQRSDEQQGLDLRWHEAGDGLAAGETRSNLRGRHGRNSCRKLDHVDPMGMRRNVRPGEEGRDSLEGIGRTVGSDELARSEQGG